MHSKVDLELQLYQVLKSEELPLAAKNCQWQPYGSHGSKAYFITGRSVIPLSDFVT
jgi:hypothetical protein